MAERSIAGCSAAADVAPIPVRSLEVLRTAYHESGHALVAHYFGRKITRVLVRGANGAVYCEKIDPAGRRLNRARVAAEEIAIAAAGYIAEDRYARSVRAERLKLDAWPFAADLGNLHYLFHVGKLNRDLYWPKLRRATSHILETAWPAVCALADELAERRQLTGDQVHQLCRQHGVPTTMGRMCDAGIHV